jgi:small subunit ribosomal protein S18
MAPPPRSGGAGRFGGKTKFTSTTAKGVTYVDYKDVETLRRLMSPNGKIYTRKRIGSSAREQRMVAQAVKRARYMGLLPYTSATL